LLSNTEWLTKFERSKIPAVNGYLMFWILAGLPAILAVAILRYSSKKSLGIRSIGFSYAVLGAVWGLFGLFMLVSWIFGSHTVLPHNTNLWLMWPTDVLYLVFGLNLLWRGRWIDTTGIFWKILVNLTRAHLVCTLIFVLAYLGHMFTQDVSRVVFWFAPLSVVVFRPSLRSKLSSAGF
jgi:hypothetical protein